MDEVMRHHPGGTPTRGDREAFERQLAEMPGDDTTRLVFADWLDEHGNPKGAERQRWLAAATEGDLRDLLATNPADDEARRVYAGRLERGDDRARRAAEQQRLIAAGRWNETEAVERARNFAEEIEDWMRQWMRDHVRDYEGCENDIWPDWAGAAAAWAERRANWTKWLLERHDRKLGLVRAVNRAVQEWMDAHDLRVIVNDLIQGWNAGELDPRSWG
jgi:uncharacterized protein (TIGR02996 family)